MKILLTNTQSYKAILIAKYLRQNYNGIKVLALIKDPIKFFFMSKYFDESIAYDVNSFIAESFITLLKTNYIDIVIPIKNSEMSFWLENKDKLQPYLNYWGSYQSFQLLNNKSKLWKLANGLGISVPKIYNSADELNLNFVIKPISSSSAKGVKYVTTNEELNRVKNSFENYSDKILQQYIKGIGIGYSCFCRGGKILIGYGHKRLAEYPVTGGSSVYRTRFFDERMIDISQTLVQAVNWSGFAMFEFKLTPDNEIYLIEVNPRIWGSINQGLQNGINYFEPLLGKSTSIKKIQKKEINTYLSPLIYLSFVKYFFNLQFKPLFTFLINIFRNKADVSLLDDPKGWLSMILRKTLNEKN